MADVTGTIGSEHVELNNAATEATLKAILASMNTLNQSVVRMSSAGGTAGAGSAAAGGAAGAAAGAAAAAAMNRVAQAGNTTGGVMSGLVGSVVKVADNLANFGSELIQGGGSVSGFYKALADLPGPMGWVAGLFSKIAELQEQELAAYRNMTSAGVNFGGELTNLRANALQLGLTLDQFSTLMKNNGKQLSLMGGTVNEGAEAFVKLGIALRDDPVSKNLRALGFTSEQVNQGLMNYISITGGRTSIEMKDTKTLSAATASYLSQLDMLASVTGESREQQEAALKEQTKNAAWQNYLQTLDETGRKNATNALASSLASGGKGAADALQSSLLGLPPSTKEAQMFIAMSGKKGSQAIDDYAKSVQGGAKGQDMINNAQAKLTTGLAETGRAMGTQLGGALINAGGAVGTMASAMLSADTRMKNAGATNEADYRTKVIDKAIADQAKRSKSSAASAAESEKAFKDMGAALYGALQPALQVITPIINDLAQEFMEFTKGSGVLEKVRDGLTTLAVYVSNFAKNLMSEEGRAKIINDLKYYFSLMMIEVKKAIIPWFSESDAKKEKEKLDKDKAVADNKAGVVKYDAGLDQKLAEVRKNDAVKKEEKKQAIATPEPVTPSQSTVKNKAKTLPTQQTQTQILEAKRQEEIKKAKEEADRVKEGVKVDTNTMTPQETLVAELKVLNKQTADSVRYMRETAEYCKRSVDAIKGLNGNLYA